MNRIKINVEKVDKKYLFKGEKGTYLDLVLFESTNQQYGDTHMVVQSIPKEERDKGERGPILGNATLELNGGSQYSAQAPVDASRNESPKVTEDDIPF
jgi:hypothetical protein|tara:strand:- start:54 stop:347 length:294 start_codon:yes stop_codon:yes gene_type:complete